MDVNKKEEERKEESKDRFISEGESECKRKTNRVKKGYINKKEEEEEDKYISVKSEREKTEIGSGV